MKKSIYYNFPINLLRHKEETIYKEIKIVMDYQDNLETILCYRIGELFSEGMNIEDVEKTMAIDIFRRTDSYKKNQINTFKEFYNQTIPRTGIERKIFWNYRDNPKDDFEFQCLWAFLAIKSIIGKKPFQKMTNQLWIARMAGFSNYKTLEEYFKGRALPSHILNPEDRYKTRYALDKIKKELTRHFNVNFYGIGSRGFYASTKLTLEELIRQVEKNRIAHIKAMENKEKRDIRQKVLEELKQEKQISATLHEAGINTASLQHDPNIKTTSSTTSTTTPTTTPK